MHPSFPTMMRDSTPPARSSSSRVEGVAVEHASSLEVALTAQLLPKLACTVEQPHVGARPIRRERVVVGTIVGGRYRIASFVAEGAFGAVYRAEDLDIAGHVVALKLMHKPCESEAEHTRSLREVQLIAAVSHPSVVSFKDQGLHRGRFFIVMPWYQGETLAHRLSTRGALTRSEARRIFTSLAEALAAMHERGIRHQDVKPENILLARLGEGQEDFPILLDLGIGARRDEQLAAFTVTYAAPEMARASVFTEHADPVDGKADVFSLVLTLFDALLPNARTLPSPAMTREALRQRATRGADLPSAPALQDLQPALARWLALDPRVRPSARELAQELTILTRRQEQRAERRRLWGRAWPFVCAVLSIVAVLAVQLRKERVRSRHKDLRIEQQEIEIGQAREAIDALSGARHAKLEDYLTLKRQTAALAAELAEEKSHNAALGMAFEQTLQKVHDTQTEQNAKRVLLLEQTLAEVDRRLGETEAHKVALLRELNHERRLQAQVREATRQEKADLAALVRELLQERDRLSERVAGGTPRSRTLLAKRGETRHR